MVIHLFTWLTSPYLTWATYSCDQPEDFKTQIIYYQYDIYNVGN